MKRTAILLLGLSALLYGAAFGQCSIDPTIRTGEATYYTFADGTGNCMYDASPADLLLGAMNNPDWANSEVCGSCVEVTGPDGTVKIRIVDRCPECLTGDIDLSPEAFAMIAPLSRGRVPISWRVVQCEVSGNVEYHFMEGSSRYWTAVQVRNHVNPIASIEFRTSGGSYKSVNRVSYNYFVEASGMGPGPYVFRLTDIYGHVVVDSNITLVDNGTVSGNVQFPPCEGEPVMTGVIDGEVPQGFWLSQNYPNPWNPQTTIRYALPTAETVSLIVYDAAGREVAVLADGHQHSGVHEVVFSSDGIASGVYYYTLRAGSHTQTRKLVLVR